MHDNNRNDNYLFLSLSSNFFGYENPISAIFYDRIEKNFNFLLTPRFPASLIVMTFVNSDVHQALVIRGQTALTTACTGIRQSSSIRQLNLRKIP